MLPSVLLVSGFVSVLLESGGEETLWEVRRVISAVVLLGAFGAVILALKDLRPRPERFEREISRTLSRSDIVYTDVGTAPTLIFFREGRLVRPQTLSSETTVAYENVSAAEMPVGAYVLLNRRPIDFTVSRAGTTKYTAPSFWTQPPESWKLISKDGKFTLFQIQ